MKAIDEKEKLRKELADLRLQETVLRHLADRKPEEYEKVNKQIKVVRRRMANLAYEEIKKKGR